MDIYDRFSEHLRTLGLKTPRLYKGVQIIQTDNELMDNERDIATQIIASGMGTKDLAFNREIDIMVQVTIKNTNQADAIADAWAIADSFDRLPRVENGIMITLASKDSSFELDTSDVYTQPRMIGKSEHGAYLYVLTVKLGITK